MGHCVVICAALLSSLGAFLFGLDIGYIAPILECWSFKRDVAHLDDETAKIGSLTAGFIVSIFSLGCIGASFPLVSTYFLDSWGRKGSIMLGTLVFLLGCWLQARAMSIWMMCLGRLVSGCAIGLLSTTVALYQSEVAPAQMRGGLTSLYQFMITAGILAAAAADVFLVELEDGWRYAICLQVLPALVLLGGMLCLPRSPRWLVQQGRSDEALSALLQLRDERSAREELKEIVANWEAIGHGGTWSDMPRSTKRVLAVGVTMQLLQQLVGMNAFMYFGPRIFHSLHLNENKFQAMNNAVNCLATLPALCLADRCGRRCLLIWGAVGMTISCCIMALVGLAKDEGDLLGSYVTISMIFAFVVNFAYGWGPIVWVVCAEIFPLRHRSRCVGLTTMSNWVGNFLIAQMSPVLLETFGFGSFLLFAFFALCALLLACWIPETKNLPLEEIESLFQKKLGGSQPSTVAAPRVLGVETENSDLLEQSPNSRDVSPATELRKTQPNSGKL